MFSQSLVASPSERWQQGLSGSEMSDREIREHWLRSKLRFSGRSSLTREGLDGQLGVAANNLIGENHALGLNFRDAKSNRDANGAKALDLDYTLPVGSADLSLNVGNHHSQHQKRASDQQIDARRESRVMGLSGSRYLMSGFGVRVDGLVRHVTRDTQAYEQGDLVSDSSYQKSALGLKGHWSEDLIGGLNARSNVSAIGGREFSASDYSHQNDVVEEERFYKLAVSATVERELFRWRWDLNGRYQFAPEDLPSSEYLMVAGSSMLAGFNGQSVYAHQGGWLRMNTASPAWPMPFVGGVLSSVNFAMLQGWVPSSGAQADRHGKASAGQVSLKLEGRAFTANVSVGRMIRASSDTMTMPDHPDVRFSLTMGI
ncbi:MAG: ShlB/FhaC/HecB family hemolysin secretion/activation protein [Pseudomonadota bacterium]